MLQTEWPSHREGYVLSAFRFCGSEVELLDYEDYHQELLLMPMKNPGHPGELLEQSFGEDGLNISIAEAARHLGISRVALSRVVNGRAAVSPELALRLERAGLSTARVWLAMQAAYDLSRAIKKRQAKVQRFAIKAGGITTVAACFID